MSEFADDDHAVTGAVKERCSVCGAKLTRAELTDAIEKGPPYLCSIHVAEALPAIAEDDYPEP